MTIELIGHQRPVFCVSIKDAEAVFRRAQESGAGIVTRITPLSFGDKVGRLRDPWGNRWWIHERMEEVDVQELKKRMQDPKATENMRYVQESLVQALNQSK